MSTEPSYYTKNAFEKENILTFKDIKKDIFQSTCHNPMNYLF